MKYRVVTGAMLILLLMGMLTLAFDIQPVTAWTGGTIYIRADGSVDPDTAPISSVDNITYILTDDITCNLDVGAAIVVERNNIVLDGANHILQGQGSTLNSIGIFTSGIGTHRNITITSLKITEFSAGLHLYNSFDIIISENNITNNWDGIRLFDSSNNTVFGNNITTNSGTGIHLGYYTNSNTISGNNIINNWKGIVLQDCSRNNITRNNIIDSHDYGILIDYATNNKFYHNNFIDNDNHATVSVGGTNTWDDGYPSGGNYWSNYTDQDFYRGPNQDEAGSDGIWDNPYVIDANNTDTYPLTKPYSGSHDIGIKNVTTSKTIVCQGYSLYINITIINYGINTENFNLTAYASTAVIGTLTEITLTSRNSTTITFTWKTMGSAKGNYTMSANATTVSGEIDTTDNNYTDSTVRVNMVGDVAPEYNIVDIVDIVYVAIHIGAKKGKPEYDPNADIDGNGIIDIVDIVIVAIHFGETDP